MSKTITENAPHYFTMKIPHKRELQKIASNHLSDIYFKDFMKFYIDYIKDSYSFLVNDASLPSDKALRFGKNLLQKCVLVRKSNQSITKSSKTKLNTI